MPSTTARCVWCCTTCPREIGRPVTGALPATPIAWKNFATASAQAIAYASALQVPRLNCLAGCTPADTDPVLVRHTLVANLRFAAEALAQHGIGLVVEMINTVDMPGFYLHRSAQALDVLHAVAHPNLQLQYDIYHMQRMEGRTGHHLAAPAAAHWPHPNCRHPSRHEPGTGEINYPFVLRHLDAIGYQGWVGCECHPLGDTQAGLVSLKNFLQTP